MTKHCRTTDVVPQEHTIRRHIAEQCLSHDDTAIPVLLLMVCCVVSMVCDYLATTPGLCAHPCTNIWDEANTTRTHKLQSSTDQAILQMAHRAARIWCAPISPDKWNTVTMPGPAFMNPFSTHAISSGTSHVDHLYLGSMRQPCLRTTVPCNGYDKTPCPPSTA